MELLLAFALVLVAAVLLSDLANRSVLSTAAIFLIAGALLGPGALGLVRVDREGDLVKILAETALVVVLFTDGLELNLPGLRPEWHLAGRALLIGLPITFVLIAGAAVLAGLAWPAALLLAAVLSPTDPVFASALVGRDEVPIRLRRLLNVESGLNDGLALPAVLILIAFDGGQGVALPVIALQLIGGIAIGLTVPWAATRLIRVPGLAIADAYRSLGPISVLLTAAGLAEVTGANTFLAAFTGAVTLGHLAPQSREFAAEVLEPIGELLKLLAVLVFGLLLTPDLIGSIRLEGWLFIAFVILVSRPLPLYPILRGSQLGRLERAAAAWFGPKGFASVVFALLVIESAAKESDRIFTLAAATIAASMLVHSMSDVPIAGRLSASNDEPTPAEELPA